MIGGSIIGSMPTSSFSCPLCQTSVNAFFSKDKKREYFHCYQCWLVFVPQPYHLSDAAEKAEYDLHENSLEDPHYRRFLSRLYEPMMDRVRPGQAGLDFGCGPAPALADMFTQAGLSMAVYDKYYRPENAVFDTHFDFVTASEVVEHLANPMCEIDKIWRCIRPGGYLGIMTKRWISAEKFSGWHYKNDPTHIVFFHLNTFIWLACRLRGAVTVCSNDVVIIRKS